MTWPGFPKRLQSALKALCCLAQAQTAMQSPAIAASIDVPKAETAKILQLLVWGGFITSRRGIKGGFQLARAADQITMGEVIDFFLARHPEAPDQNSPVMRALEDSLMPGEQKFSHLTLSEVVKFPNPPSGRKQTSTARHSSVIRKLSKRSRRNASNR